MIRCRFPIRPIPAALFFLAAAFFVAVPAGSGIPALIADDWYSGSLHAQEAPALLREKPTLAQADTTPPESGEEGFFFGASDGFEKKPDTFLDNAFSGQNESSGIHEENTNQDGKWLDEDISPLFPELKILDDVSSESSLKRMESARRQYREALHTLQAGEVAALSEKEKRSALKISGGEEWRAEELDERIERHMESARARHRAAAIGRLVKSIQLLDSIQNPSVLASDPYLDLKAKVYRQYVKQQFKSRNLQYCVEILEAYLKMRPQHQKEAEAHRLLAACYRHQEVLSERMQDRPNSRDFKSKKNNHLMKYALLAYGKDSPEYDAIERNVQRDLIETYAPANRK
ncbi:MAG: hypothetical protein RIF32_00620 [Leptospirales bacterium]|jgi:hypothetical protein